MGNAASISNLDKLQLANIRLIPFHAFKALGTTPRYPENKDLTITLADMSVEMHEQSLIVFISHCWLRGWDGAEGWDGRPHPDSADGGKYELCVEGIEKILTTLAPGMTECYIWLDYGCIDQNGNPAGELKQLDKIVQVCDCIFTPILDRHHVSWQFPDLINNWFEAYKSSTWMGNQFSYLNRGWCRVEMFYAANIPLLADSESRRSKFASGLLYHRSQGRRPHLLYGSKERDGNAVPITLPPLQNSYFNNYHPIDGSLTKESDKVTIEKLIEDLRPHMRFVQAGYEGDLEDGKRHGKGRLVAEDGGVYEGEWVNDLMHGHGKYVYASGAMYEGEYKEGVINGQGKFIYANGDVYEGSFKDRKRHGEGKFIFANGDVYEGGWKENMMHGYGKRLFIDGSRYEGEWEEDKMHGHGKYVNVGGDMYDGEWREGEMDGKGMLVHTNGEVEAGVWSHGVRARHVLDSLI